MSAAGSLIARFEDKMVGTTSRWGDLERFPMRLTHSAATYSVRSPPPCGEGLGVGVVCCGLLMHASRTTTTTPLPQGGREQTECAAPLCVNDNGKRSNLMRNLSLAAKVGWG